MPYEDAEPPNPLLAAAPIPSEPPIAAAPLLPEPEPPGPDEDGAPPKPLFAAAPIPPEPPVLDQPVTPSAPEVMLGTGGGGELLEAKKPILAPSETIALFIPALVVIGVVILATYFFFTLGNKSVLLENNQKQASLAVTNPVAHEGVMPSLVVEAVGMGFASLSEDTRYMFRLSNYSFGVVVTNVDPGSAAAEKHIQPGYVLEAINDKSVNDPADVAKIMQALKRDGKKSAGFSFVQWADIGLPHWKYSLVTLPLLW